MASGACVECQKVLNAEYRKTGYLKVWREENRELTNSYRRAGYQRNADKERAASRKHYAENTQYYLDWASKNSKRQVALAKARRQVNPGPSVAAVAKRRAALDKRTPVWLTSLDHKAIATVYIEAARLTKKTGVEHQVDHELPLRGRSVSGLHVPLNLRVITRTENLIKSNKLCR